jgi:hypothetical protein
MRLLLSLLLVLTLSLSIQGQSDTTSKDKNSIRLGLFGEKTFADPGSVYYGLSLQIPLGKEPRWYLNYRFGMGKEHPGNFGFRTPWGMAHGIRGFGEIEPGTDNFLDNTARFLLFLTILLPEGVGFKIPVGKKVELLPFINPICSETVNLPMRERLYIRDFGESGVQAFFKIRNEFFFSVFGGAKAYYDDGRFGFFSGASMGVRSFK